MLTWPFRGNNSGKMADSRTRKAKKARALAVITTILPIFIIKKACKIIADNNSNNGPARKRQHK